MKTTVLTLLLALPSAGLAATTPNAADSDSVSSSAYSATADAVEATTSKQDQTPVVRQAGDDGRGKLVGSLAASGIYTRQYTLNSDSVQQFAGWAITPEVNLTKHIGFQADFISLYGSDVYPSVNKFTIAAGPRYTFNPYWKATPFVFGEAGETRTTYGRNAFGSHPSTDWNPTAKAGIGFDFKVRPNFAIQIVPGEWTAERFDYNSKWQQNYQARLGFVFNLRK